MKLTPEKQAEVDQIVSKLYAELPPDARAKVDQIRAEGSQEVEDREAEFEARIKQLKSGGFRLIPIAELAWSAAFAARQAEPLESRKDLAACESGRAFIRAIKTALLDGSLVAREQGSGIPVNDRSWCLENDTLLSLPKMMPHDRLMVRTDEVKAWLETMGIATDAFPLLNLAAEGLSLVQQAPSKLEPGERVREQTTSDATDSSAASPSKPSETPEERGERLLKRVKEIKAAGIRAFLKQLATEEGLEISTIKGLLYRAEERRNVSPRPTHLPPAP